MKVLKVGDVMVSPDDLMWECVEVDGNWYTVESLNDGYMMRILKEGGYLESSYIIPKEVYNSNLFKSVYKRN